MSAFLCYCFQLWTIKKPRDFCLYPGFCKTFNTNKKAHGNNRKRFFSLVVLNYLNVADFGYTKKSENALIICLYTLITVCFLIPI